MSIYLGTTPVASTGYDKANTDLSNLASTGKNIANWSSNITNCITEIPQDIKLELNDGTLILKAGSKVYVPNGFEEDGTTPKFDVVTIAIDKSLTWAQNRSGDFFCYNPTRDSWAINTVTKSGSSANDGIFYNTTTNQIIDINVGNISGYSLPLFEVTSSSTQIISIDQVFNGFGYIGSTVFALPGVKGLIPNGRNADGSLKNIETSVSNVRLLTLSSSVTLKGNGRFLLGASDNILARVGNYDEKNNYVLGGNGVDKLYGCVFADNCTVTSGVINIFNPKTAFHAVDYNDTIVKSDLATCHVVTQTYVNGNSWYRVYSDGWVEQGGRFSSADQTNTTVTFLKQFANTDYTPIVGQQFGLNGQTQYRTFNISTISSDSMVVHNATNGTNTCIWMACGYGA